MRNLVLICLLSSVLCSPSPTEKHPSGGEKRIINGEKAAKGQFPWQVALFRREFVCGGALISDKWILTAGHCVQNIGDKDFSVSLGAVDLYDPDRVARQSEQVIQHEKFADVLEGNDIALIKLSQPVKFTDNIKAIDLVEYPINESTTVTVSGWGWGNGNKPNSNFLNYVSLITISDRKCEDKFRKPASGSFCAEKTTDEAQGTCLGDGGGPLVIYNNEKPLHVGIVSYFSPGCITGQPDAFTSTAIYRQWIKEKSGV